MHVHVKTRHVCLHTHSLKRVAQLPFNSNHHHPHSFHLFLFHFYPRKKKKKTKTRKRREKEKQTPPLKFRSNHIKSETEQKKLTTKNLIKSCSTPPCPFLIGYHKHPSVLFCFVSGMEGEASKNSNENESEVREMIEMIEKVGSYNDFRKTQRTECVNLVRRLKLLLPLLEEIRDSEEEAALVDLKMALLASKKLLKTCNSGSKIFLVSSLELEQHLHPSPPLLSLTALYCSSSSSSFSRPWRARR